MVVEEYVVEVTQIIEDFAARAREELTHRLAK